MRVEMEECRFRHCVEDECAIADEGALRYDSRRIRAEVPHVWAA